jgi:hypothetical protein
MARTSTVKGIGKASTKYDYVILSISLESQNMNYQTAIDSSAIQLEHTF